MGKVNESKEVSEAVWRLFFTTPGKDSDRFRAFGRGSSRLGEQFFYLLKTNVLSAQMGYLLAKLTGFS